ncbi:MAG: hypothetical protein ABGX63_05775 [bacterium]
MKKYSKLIGLVIGLIISVGGIYGVNLEFLNAPGVQAAILTIVPMFTTWVAPANAPV